MSELTYCLILAIPIIIVVEYLFWLGEKNFQARFKNCEYCGADSNLRITSVSSDSDIPWYICSNCNKKNNPKRKGSYAQRFPKSAATMP